MPYIHELPAWPRFTWDSAALVGPLAAVRHDQGRLLGRMGSLGFALRDEASLSALTADVVKSSAIEGESLDPAEVRSSIARRLGLEAAGLARASRAVEGIVEMMLDATQNFASPLTGERLFAWHASLFPTGRSGMQPIAVGRWRSEEAGLMDVVSGPIGKERVHFRAPVAERLPDEMSHFLEWFNASGSLDPVLKAGLAHLWFVTIHPFEDGNGRLARAIGDLALARADGAPQRFYSLSAQIESQRKEYYAELERTQRGGLDITAWFVWFLECLAAAIAQSEERLSGVLRKGRLWDGLRETHVNDRQRLVLNRMLEDWEGFLTTSKYARLAKCSTDTALRDIQELVRLGALAPNPGKGRGASYRVADL